MGLNMVKKNTLLLSLLLTFCMAAQAQQYGFEWIKTYQSYYKFCIGQNAVVRLNATTLQSAGVNLSTLSPAKLQVFKNGVEQLIYVKGFEDGQFDATDFIELYTEKNDGTLDSVLYANKAAQPHTFYSLFSDTSCYFLTILPDTSSILPRRFIVVNDNNIGAYTTEDFFTEEVIIAPVVDYLDGPNMAPGSELKYLTSDYEQGEGWAGRRVGQTQSETYSANTPFKYTLGGNASLTFKVIGASDAVRNINAQNHHFTLGYSTNNSVFSTLADYKYAGYDQPILSANIPISDVGTVSYFKLQTLNDIGVLSDFNSLSYIRFSYPRQYNWGNTTFKKLTVNNTKGGVKTRIDISSYGTGLTTNPVVLDLTSGIRVNALYNSGTVTVLLTNDNKPHQIVIADSAQIGIVETIKPVVFNITNLQNGAAYVIVSNTSLSNATNQYAQYRSNKISVLNTNIDELYNYFYYGIKHPLAIKRLASYLLNEAEVKPNYLLLAGKGYQNDKIRIATVNSTNPSDYYNRNLVPCLGMPASDALFAAGINGNGSYPEIAIGRIPALTNMELQNYLDKIIYTETTIDTLAEWQKKVIHVSGGDDLNQQIQFTNQINKNKRLIEGQFVGANVTSFNKNTTEEQQENLKQQIINAQNEGASLFSFLGHASLTILDVDIGTINDMNNPNKYPFYYFNGCNVGNAGEVDVSGTGNIYGKDYLCAANKGALGWLAHSNFTFDGTLFRMMDAFYTNYCLTNYRMPIGDMMQSISKNFNASDVISKSHIIQWQLQGDPLLLMDNAGLPDFKVSNNDLFTSPKNITVQEDSFAFNIIVTNLGKATSDTVVININHRLPNNSIVQWPAIKYNRVYYKDTLTYWLKYEDMKTLLGNNVFEVEVDGDLLVQEGNELNNRATYNAFIAGSGVSVLLPSRYEIVSSDSVTLIGQNNTILIKDAEYLFEIDTLNTFNSPAFRSSGVVRSGATVSYSFSLPYGDSVAYYWRVRLNLPISQGGQWDQSSFSHISNGGTGFAQLHYQQLTDVEKTDQIKLNANATAFEYTSTFKNVKSLIGRWAHGGMGVLDPFFNTPQVGSCVGPDGFICVLFDANTLKRISQPGFPTNCNPNQTGTIYNYYAFNTENTTGQNDLARFIDSVSVGNYIAGFSYYYSGANTWTPQLRSAFASLGLSKISALQSNFNACSFIVKKGFPNESVEDTVFDNSGLNSSPLKAISEKEIEGKKLEGSISTKLIGPALSWNKCTVLFDSIQESDAYAIKIYGVTNSFVDTLLLTGTMQSVFNLESINAKVYPFVKVKMDLLDSVNRSPLQPHRIIVNYAPIPELTFDALTKFDFYSNNLQQGDSLKINVAIKNISANASDSSVVAVRIKDGNRIAKFYESQKIPPLATQEVYMFSKNIATYNLVNNNEVAILLNEDQVLKEVSYLNNYIFQSVAVKTDQTNPLLDVTFDGYRIMSGDIVSPKPVIRMVSKDDNKFRIQHDTSTFALFIKKPTSLDYERIPLDAAVISFIPGTSSNNTAMIEYKPEQMENGSYSLKVQAKDASGNLSGNNSYEVLFTVINESTITNFYPYPNPGTTNIRFVFTLTGSKIPDQLLIRIMTITGKIVKEITSDEFGAIRIGNNVSEYGWDGTDNYGDRLANGVYLYQVLTRIDGNVIEKRETVADKYVTHNTGKIYLLK
jgi:hypothetical protein